LGKYSFLGSSEGRFITYHVGTGAIELTEGEVQAVNPCFENILIAIHSSLIG